MSDEPTITGGPVELWMIVATTEDDYTYDALEDMAQQINDGETPLLDEPEGIPIGDVDKAEIKPCGPAEYELWVRAVASDHADIAFSSTPREPIEPLATLRAIADKGPEHAAPHTIEAACQWAHQEIKTLRANMLQAVLISEQYDDPDEIHRELRQLL